MTTARTATATATAALLLAAVTACVGEASDPSEGRSQSTPSVTPSTSPSSATPPTESESAAAAAAALVRNYYGIRDELRSDPSGELGRLKDIAVSGELTAQQILFERERKAGHHQTGTTQIVELAVRSVNLDNSDPESGRVPTVQVDVCYDVKNVDILNRNDQSIVASDRPDTGWIRYLVSNFNYEVDPSDSWRVASSQNLERTPCDPV